MVDLFYYKFTDGITAVFWGKDKINHLTVFPGAGIGFGEKVLHNVRYAHYKNLKLPYSRWVKLIKTKHS